MRLLLDEMYPATAAATLRARGHDVIAVTDHTDLRGLSDSELMDVAALADRIIATDNVGDFLRLFAERIANGMACPSVVAVTSVNRNTQSFTGELIRAIDAFIERERLTGHPQVWFA